MRDLRREREVLSLSREEISAQTRIPMRYISALEDAEDAASGGAPFLFGYRRQYEAFLDSVSEGAALPEAGGAPAPYVRAEEQASNEAEGEEQPPSVPLVRLVVGGFAATLILVLAIKVVAMVAERPPAEKPTAEEAAAAAEEALGPVQKVEVRSTEPTRITVVADGETLFSGVLNPGQTRAFEGRERLELDTSELTVLTVRHNGERIEPLGNLSYGRRLVFIQESK